MRIFGRAFKTKNTAGTKALRQECVWCFEAFVAGAEGTRRAVGRERRGLRSNGVDPGGHVRAWLLLRVGGSIGGC